MAKSKNTYIEYKGQPIPVKVYVENRKNIRFSIASKYAIIRLQRGLTKSQTEEQFKKFKDWIIQNLDASEELRERFIGKVYEDGSTLKVFNRVYTIRFIHKERKTIKAKIVNETIIQIEMDRSVDYPFLQKDLRQLISRVVGANCLSEIEKKVDYYNDRYFQETINSVHLKMNQSNWGSCSNNRNLNFSTRLLFAPDDVINYLIIHELAHLKEFNHSARFWKIVSDIMPDYEAKEQWLKENGHLCHF